jgi:drug/metabolite transporter (DMT)-like permease
MTASQQQQRSRIIVAFALLYVLWGSTYLAMRVIVRDMPPYVAGAIRYLVAGPIMLAALALAGRKIRIGLQDLRRLLVIGVLLLSIGNIGVLWGEEYVPSGLASLVVALVPIWVVMIEAWGFRAGRMTPKGLFGLALGIVGLLVLLWPKITSGSHLGRVELFGSAILAGASFFWALGSVFSHRYELSVDVFVSAAWQMTLAGIVNALIAATTGQFQHTRWTVSALASIGYLVIFGSWLGYSSYIYLLEHVPTPKVATYAYVNPIVAVFLGWAILREKVDVFMLLGTAIIIASVWLVNSSKLKQPPENMQPIKDAPSCQKAMNLAGD